MSCRACLTYATEIRNLKLKVHEEQMMVALLKSRAGSVLTADDRGLLAEVSTLRVSRDNWQQRAADAESENRRMRRRINKLLDELETS